MIWKELNSSYSDSKRKYHNLAHLDNLYKELLPVKNAINDWNILLFSIAYHDIVYNVLKNDNEEKSAAKAVSRLKQLNIPPDKIESCRLQILATKVHSKSDSSDTDYFTDADLSVLGYDPDAYLKYTSQIRKEYRYYPDLIYKPGRKKVLNHFLAMSRIYKTDHFYSLYEEKARMNIAHEFEILS